ncbi:hypothetical protein HHI36_014829, partial [Cryptolaemus montrouzieri]
LEMTPMQIIEADLNYSLLIERSHNEQIENYLENFNDISEQLENGNQKNLDRLEQINQKRSAKEDHTLNHNPTYIDYPITQIL